MTRAKRASGNTALGQRAERYVADILRSRGYDILDKNYRIHQIGEIDLIAGFKDELLFIEVKARSCLTDYNIENACISRKKLLNIRKCADIYLQQELYRDSFCRIVGAFVHIKENGDMGEVRMIPLD